MMQADCTGVYSPEDSLFFRSLSQSHSILLCNAHPFAALPGIPTVSVSECLRLQVLRQVPELKVSAAVTHSNADWGGGGGTL